MNVICPEHGGAINIVGKPFKNAQNVTIINLVVECPVCQEEVLVNGLFNLDNDGNPYKIADR